ncbi:MAG: protein phosphatase 2C domain-containing protein [Planctomycetota bacterium]
MKKLLRSRVWAGLDLPSPRSFTVGPGHVALVCAPGPVPAHHNEDTAAVIPISPETVVLVVADGIGGESNGEIVSRFAVEMVRLFVELLFDQVDSLAQLLVRALEQTNQAILQSTSLGGTTAVIAIVHQDKLRLLHAGDSRALLTSRSGEVLYETTDHTVTQHLVKCGLIPEAEAIRDSNRHLLTNALGQSGMEVEASAELEFADGATLLLATDGLTDNLTIPEIAGISRERSLNRMVDRLVDSACAHMTSPDTGKGLQPKRDNITVVAFRRRHKTDSATGALS